MKTMYVVLLCLGVWFCPKAKAQVWLKAEYIGSSAFRDENNKKVGGKGDMKVIQGGFNIPVSMKMDENNHPTAWMVGLGASYASLSNKNLTGYVDVPQLFNAQIALSHIRPVNKKWSLMASVGMGLFMDTGSLAYARWKNVMGVGVAAAIWHLRDNLDLGMGLALNTSFGYPMVFPAFFVDWRIEGSYLVEVSMMDGAEIAAGMQLNDLLRLKLVASMNGMLAFVEHNGKDKIFSQQYITVGLQLELILSKSFSIPFTIGFTADRTAYYDDRSLKAFFKAMSREHDPHFSPAFYTSIAIKYGF